MNVRDLLDVKVICESGSLRKAALVLGVTQPTLSNRISHLEDQLGSRLFDRSRGQSRPTDLALFIARRSDVISVEASRLVQDIRRVASGQRGLVRIGVGPIPARMLLARIAVDDQRAIPGHQHRDRFKRYPPAAAVAGQSGSGRRHLRSGGERAQGNPRRGAARDRHRGRRAPGSSDDRRPADDHCGPVQVPDRDAAGGASLPGAAEGGAWHRPRRAGRTRAVPRHRHAGAGREEQPRASSRRDRVSPLRRKSPPATWPRSASRCRSGT